MMSNLAYDENQERGLEASERDISALQAVRPIPRISIHAFCESEGVARPIERAAEDRRMARAHVKVSMGGIDAAADF